MLHLPSFRNSTQTKTRWHGPQGAVRLKTCSSRVDLKKLCVFFGYFLLWLVRTRRKTYVRLIEKCPFCTFRHSGKHFWDSVFSGQKFRRLSAQLFTGLTQTCEQIIVTRSAPLPSMHILHQIFLIKVALWITIFQGSRDAFFDMVPYAIKHLRSRFADLCSFSHLLGEMAFLVRNLFPPDLTSIEFAFSDCFVGFRTISKTGSLFASSSWDGIQNPRRTHFLEKTNDMRLFFDEDLDYPMKCFRNIYGYRMIRWVNVCNIVTIVRNPKHVLKCSTSLACVDSTGGFAPSSTRRWGHGFRIKAELPRLQTPKIRKYSKKCFGNRLQHVRGCFMYVKSNTSKSTSLFESLKSYSVTARKLLENKRLLGCFRAHSCTKAAYFCVFGPMRILRRLVVSSSRAPLTFDILFTRWPAHASTSLRALRIGLTPFWEAPMTLPSSNGEGGRSKCAAIQHGRQRHTLHIF